MKNLLIISALFLSFSAWTQESHGSKTISYVIDLNMLKHETQELKIEKELKLMEGVQSCDVDALNYKLYLTVFEPKTDNKSIEIEDVKYVLANNNVEIVNYTQKAVITK